MDHRRTVGQAQAVAEHEGIEFGELRERRHVLFKLGTRFFFGAVADLPAKKGLRVEVARYQFQVQLQKGHQFTHLGRRKRVGGQQGVLWVLVFDVLHDHARLAQRALCGLEVGHFAQGAGHRIGLAHPGQLFGEGHTFFEQGEFDFVVVVAGRKAAECEHGGLLVRVLKCPSVMGHSRLTRRQVDQLRASRAGMVCCAIIWPHVIPSQRPFTRPLCAGLVDVVHGGLGGIALGQTRGFAAGVHRHRQHQDGAGRRRRRVRALDACLA